MISNSAGTTLKKNTKTKIWWIKLGVAIVVSNVFFFLLFSGNETPAAAPAAPQGWVELQIRADLLTPFQKGKKVLLVNRFHRKQIEGVLEEASVEPEGRTTVFVQETDAPTLFKLEQWEILPFIKTLTFPAHVQGEQHEIRY